MKLKSIFSQFRLIHTTILCVRFCLVNIGKLYNARLMNKTSRKRYYQFVKQYSNVMRAEYICDLLEIYMKLCLTQTLFVTGSYAGRHNKRGWMGLYSLSEWEVRKTGCSNICAIIYCNIINIPKFLMAHTQRIFRRAQTSATIIQIFAEKYEVINDLP